MLKLPADSVYKVSDGREMALEKRALRWGLPVMVLETRHD